MGELNTPAAVDLSTLRWLDHGEQLLALVLYTWFVASLWPHHLSADAAFTILLFVSEGIVCALLVIRRPTSAISTEIGDWLIAGLGTFLALLIRPGGAPVSLPLGGMMLIAGMMLHVGAKVSLWRGFGLVAANRGVTRRGVYRLVRHPMYAGYFLCHVGVLLVKPSIWNATVYVAVWSLLIARIMREERILRADARYGDYAAQVRYRLVPGLF